MSPEATNLEGKRVLVFGAAGLLGSTQCRALAAAGARLALTDVRLEQVSELADELGAEALMCDVADEQSVVAAVKASVDVLGGLDGVLNDAAATTEGQRAAGDPPADPENYPLDAWRHAIDVNLTGAFLVARESGKALKAAGGGSLVLVSSIYGLVGPDHRIYDRQPFNTNPGYSASKAGVLGLARWMATLWGADGVRVNCVTPGGVYNDHDPGFVEAYSARAPLGRMAERDELNGIILFLLSDASSYCTGQNFIVDGGLTAW